MAKLAENLGEWEGEAMSRDYVQTSYVETTGGDISIDSSLPANLKSVVPTTDFFASQLISTGFNLLRRATAVGNGWYFEVPHLVATQQSIGTALQNNGVLFTNSNHANLTPTVYFKALSAGVPYQRHRRRCRHLHRQERSSPLHHQRSGLPHRQRYRPCERLRPHWLEPSLDDYQWPTLPMPEPWSIWPLASTPCTPTTRCSSSVPWPTALSARVRTKSPGRAASTVCSPLGPTPPSRKRASPRASICTKADISANEGRRCRAFVTTNIGLTVDGTKVSYTDSNAEAATDYVKYELAAEVTGTAAVSSTFACEDWGLIILKGATGTADVVLDYAQNVPDNLRTSLPIINDLHHCTGSISQGYGGLRQRHLREGQDRLYPALPAVAGRRCPRPLHHAHQHRPQHPQRERHGCQAYPHPRTEPARRCCQGTDLCHAGLRRCRLEYRRYVLPRCSLRPLPSWWWIWA